MEQVLNELQIDKAALLNRFAGSEALAVRFLKKFLQDPTFQTLKEAIAAQDQKAIEMAAHTLKGVCANLEMTKLSTLNAQIVDAVRAGNTQEIPALMEQAQAEYERIVAGLQKLA